MIPRSLLSLVQTPMTSRESTQSTNTPTTKPGIATELYKQLNGLKRNWEISTQYSERAEPVEITVSHFSFSKHLAVHAVRDDTGAYTITAAYTPPPPKEQKQTIVTTGVELQDVFTELAVTANKMVRDRSPTAIHFILDRVFETVFNAVNRINRLRPSQHQ